MNLALHFVYNLTDHFHDSSESVFCYLFHEALYNFIMSCALPCSQTEKFMYINIIFEGLEVNFAACSARVQVILCLFLLSQKFS
jgi:hypothetical protein